MRPLTLLLALAACVAGAAPPQKRYPWPVRVDAIGATIGCYQGYSGLPGGAYFHGGVDILNGAGNPVLASSGGRVSDIKHYDMDGPDAFLYWMVEVTGEDGLVWQYLHLRKDSIPKEIWDAYRSLKTIPERAKLGEVVAWNRSWGGKRYDHIHLNVLRDRERLNPFAVLEPLADTAAPQILKIGIVYRESEEGVLGSYTIAVDAQDHILSPDLAVTPYRMEYSVDNEPWITVWRFDSLPYDSSNYFVNALYIPGLSCGEGPCRRFVWDLGFSPNGFREFPKEPGPHRLRVRASDFQGNQTEKQFDWTVQTLAAGSRQSAAGPAARVQALLRRLRSGYSQLVPIVHNIGP